MGAATVDGRPVSGEVGEQMRLAWNAAMTDFDYKKLSQIYDEDVLFFGSSATLHEGRQGVRDYFAAIPGEACSIELHQRSTSLIDDGVATLCGIVTFHLQIAGKVQQIRMRLSWVFKKRSDGWKIAIHHASPVPA